MKHGWGRQLAIHMTDVGYNLVLVARIVRSGGRVVFDKDGSPIEDQGCNQRIQLGLQECLLTMRVWAQVEHVHFVA